MKYCSNCGHLNQEDANFCIKCGHSFENRYDWYYAKGDRKIGPYTAEEIKDLFEKQMISGSTYVWKKGLSEWVPLNQAGLLDVREPKLERSTSSVYSDPGERDRDVFAEIPQTYAVDDTEDVETIVNTDTPNTADDWYYADGLQEKGPVSKTEMIRLTSRRIIGPDTLVRQASQKEWMAFSEAGLLPVQIKKTQGDPDKKSWYYAIKEETFGPFSKAELLHFYQIGKINQMMYVWNQGMDDWVLFKDSELMPQISVTSDQPKQKKREVSKLEGAQTVWKQTVFPTLKKIAVVLKRWIGHLLKMDSKNEDSLGDSASKLESKNVLSILIFLFIVCLVGILSFFVFQ